nr:type II toxin-antitoxin system VapC family toxin [uncultured Noviherbaspirillum sp.]
MFVLDNSIVMRWLLNDRDAGTQSYAQKVLDLLADGEKATVPNLWALEASNVIIKQIRKKNIRQSEANEFIALLGELDIQPDAATHDHALGDTLGLAQRHGLSSYDASYLELALRLGVRLATVDDDLAQAMRNAGGTLISMN